MAAGKEPRRDLAIKGSRVVFFMACLTFIFGSLSFAETCPDLIGDWDYSSSWANYDPSGPGYSFTTQTGIIHITEQSNCVFYGTVEMLTPSIRVEPATGAVYNGKNIILTAGDSTFHGILGARKKGLYMKINFSSSNISINGDDQTLQGASQGNATRRP